MAKKIKNKVIGIKDLTKYVVFSIVVLLIYSITAIVFQAVTGNELSSTLTTCLFGCFGGEILACALIKIFKLKEERKDDGFTDSEYDDGR